MNHLCKDGGSSEFNFLSLVRISFLLFFLFSSFWNATQIKSHVKMPYGFIALVATPFISETVLSRSLTSLHAVILTWILQKEGCEDKACGSEWWRLCVEVRTQHKFLQKLTAKHACCLQELVCVAGWPWLDVFNLKSENFFWGKKVIFIPVFFLFF